MDDFLDMALRDSFTPRMVAEAMPSDIFRAMVAVEARGTLRHQDVKLYFQALKLNEDQIEMLYDMVPPSRDGRNTGPRAEQRWEQLMDAMRDIVSPDVFEKAGEGLDEAVRMIRDEFGEEYRQAICSEMTFSHLEQKEDK